MSSGLADAMQALYTQFGELPGVQIELHKSLLAVRVHNDCAEATVFLQGAQLSHYQRHGEQPLLWCSPDCDYRAGTPLRGGIPVCWPWFGDLDKNPSTVRDGLPTAATGAHGFARNRTWQLDTIEALDSRQTRLQLSLALAAGDEPAWPTATRLVLTIDVGATLGVALETHNLSEQPVALSAALHTYFAVSAIDDIVIEGLDGLDYIDCVADWSAQRQRGAVSINAETDRIYHGTDRPVSLVDRGWHRAVYLHSSGSGSAIVWNPWIDKARRLSHFGDLAYRDMVCIETANADRDFIQLAPAQSHRLAVTLESRPLDGSN